MLNKVKYSSRQSQFRRAPQPLAHCLRDTLVMLHRQTGNPRFLVVVAVLDGRNQPMNSETAEFVEEAVS